MPLVIALVVSRWAQLCSVQLTVLKRHGLCLPGLPASCAVGSYYCPLSFLVPPERSQDSTAVALSDSSSTQDFFNEPASSLEGLRKPYTEKKLPVANSQVGPTGKDLQGTTEDRGMKT